MDAPFYVIPAAPASFTAGAILARLSQGIGFRYRWASEGLSAEDLDFRPTPESRSIGELFQHIHTLLRWVGESVGLDTEAPWMRKSEGMAARVAALHVARELADRFLSMSEAELAACVVHRRGQDYPLWNAVNGPLADSLTHIGQIASWRRIKGNPIPGADVFQGQPPAST
jgi:hypothetical protein